MISVFVPGKLRNPLNGSWGGWRKHARLAKDWRERTAQHVLVALIGTQGLSTRAYMKASGVASAPKRVTFTAHVGHLWDTDSIPAAIKPIRDGLVDAGVVHSDAPTSGHLFLYEQMVDKQRGVTVTVEAL